MPEMRDVGQDIRNSRNAFVNLVWPTISNAWFDGADLEPVEGESDSLKFSMDTKAGIDYWTVGDGMQSIASRVQNVNRDFGTFTVRVDRNNGSRTELQKRAESVESDKLTPTWTVQAYINAPIYKQTGLGDIWIVEKGEIINAARARQREVVSWVQDGYLGAHYGENGTGGNKYVGENEDFYYIHWYDYNRFRSIDWLESPSIRPSANVLLPDMDPAVKQTERNQNTLDGFGD